eukprot:CAMPEP_0201566002 /NCGR_PEP_ID=MMETSP0190_2-20130828/5488_1 /ASSEMBLY_ACC=CAM_ASM_000263 /TAXON_ID=37353 /ORGANISM="Rosalina sp." /LENGTH=221 /DNA_ID=CAMNT_0047984141 /DNA_START=11 /DNA_END=672 /DNA_ORIENTATION=+
MGNCSLCKTCTDSSQTCETAKGHYLRSHLLSQDDQSVLDEMEHQQWIPKHDPYHMDEWHYGGRSADMDSKSDETSQEGAGEKTKPNQMQNHNLKIALPGSISKPNLFRSDTKTPWSVNDLKDLQDDMLGEIHAQARALSEAGPTPHEATPFEATPKVDYLDMETRTSSNLINGLSHDWCSSDMEVQETEMLKHLHHLKSVDDITNISELIVDNNDNDDNKA